MNWVSIGKRFKALRGDESLREFSKRLGTSDGFLSEVERAKKKPSVKLIARLEEISGRSYSWILTGKEEGAGRTSRFAEERLSVVHGKEAGEKLLGLVETLLKDRELYVKYDDLIVPVAKMIKHTGQIARKREAGEKARAKKKDRRKGRKSSA